MTLEIGLVLFVLVMVFIAFMREWTSPDLIAMTAFCTLIACGIIDARTEAFSIFSNHAPITIAAMFILSAALERTGVIDKIGHFLGEHLSTNLRSLLLVMTISVGICSAFLNNTPIVAIFMPVLLGLGRSRSIPASKLLIPLSYSSIMGGCCTLIGTSTNIIVSDVVSNQYGLEPLGMFELAWVGIPFMIIGITYIVVLSPMMIPDRENITSILSPEDRKMFLCHVLVSKKSPLVGQKLMESPLGKSKGEFRIIEIRRNGTRLLASLDEVTIQAYDRFLISASGQHMEEDDQGLTTLDQPTRERLGIESLSTVEGSIIEGIVAPESPFIGKTIRQLRFRQTYGMVILAVHRKGRNVAKEFQSERLQFGDTLLLLGPVSTFAQMRQQGELMLLEDQIPAEPNTSKAPIAIAVMAGVILLASLNILPIVAASIIGCLIVLLTRCMEPNEAYSAVHWQIIFLIYGMLGVGLAMEKSGAALWLAGWISYPVETWVPAAWQAIVLLSLVYLLTNIMTEMLSNNATAVIMAPIAISLAMENMGLDPRPFIIAVTIAASASFVTPLGYQTNTMVYGAGGYRFSDFVKFGLPINIVFWLTATFLIPKIWPFQTLQP